MSFVRVEQRNAHLAAAVRLEHVNGREGKVAKATLTAISNARRGSGEASFPSLASVIQQKVDHRSVQERAAAAGYDPQKIRQMLACLPL